MTREPCGWCSITTTRRVLVRHADDVTGRPALLAPACDHHATTLVRLDEYGQKPGAERGSRIARAPAQLTLGQEAGRDEHLGPDRRLLVAFTPHR